MSLPDDIFPRLPGILQPRIYGVLSKKSNELRKDYWALKIKTGSNNNPRCMYMRSISAQRDMSRLKRISRCNSAYNY